MPKRPRLEGDLRSERKRDEAASQQLGMRFSTAQARLRKSVMWNLARLAGMGDCYVCGEEIGTPLELSIEHKEPWLHVSPDLFWDFDNIAFSHVACNKPRRTVKGRILPNRLVGPEGTSWCCVCKEFLPEKMFNKHSGRWNGKQSRCKEHHASDSNTRYAADTENINLKRRKRYADRKQK